MEQADNTGAEPWEGSLRATGGTENLTCRDCWGELKERPWPNGNKFVSYVNKKVIWG